MYVRFTVDGVAETKFLCNVKITDGTANSITETLLQVLAQRDLNVRQLIGFISDDRETGWSWGTVGTACTFYDFDSLHGASPCVSVL